MTSRLSILSIGVITCAAALAVSSAAQPPGPRQDRRPSGPAAGSDAPDFQLRILGSTKTLKLSDYEGKKPVVLIFGSYT